MCCDIKKIKEAVIEVLKSLLVVSAVAALYAVTQTPVKIPSCTGEVLFEFLIGGLTLQICLGIGDAFIHTLFGCTTIDCTVHKIVENILEPIVFIGGFFSIYTYCKSTKGSREGQYAKYSALGNLIGSTITIVLAIYFCLQIEEDANKKEVDILARQVAQDASKREFNNNNTNGFKELYNHFSWKYLCENFL